MTAGHSAFLSEREEGTFLAWQGSEPGKALGKPRTQVSLPCSFQCGEKLTDGLPAVRVVPVEGKNTPALARSAAPLCPVRECFQVPVVSHRRRGSSSAGKLGPHGDPEQQQKRKDRFTHLCPHLGQELLSEASPVPAPPISLLLPLPRHRAILSNRGGLFPPQRLALVFLWLRGSGPISLLFATTPLLRCSLLRETVLITLLRYSPLSLPPPHSPWFITHSLSLYLG